MRLYLDDDSANVILVRLLRREGHDVEIPADAALAGSADPVHLTHAIGENRTSLSANHDDFRDLHALVLKAQGRHPSCWYTRPSW
jgi:hypothetical protein